MNAEKLEEIIADFASEAEREFTLTELSAYVQKKGVRASMDELYDSAAVSDHLFENDPVNKVFFPRRFFFKGAQFRITPLEAEVEGGYLMPGHRFMPFLSDKVLPRDAQLFLPDGSVVPCIKRSLPQSMAMAGLLFFGTATAVDYLLFEDEDNVEGLIPPFDADVSIPVFDLSEFYASSGFRSGDSLMLTVKDWLQGTFEVVRADPALDVVAETKWTEAMTAALNEAIDEFGPEGDCNFQFALAMRNAQEKSMSASLMSNPPLSLAAYFNLQEGLIVKERIDRALFWPVDDEPMGDELWDALEDPVSELDVLFQDIGLSITEGEVEAYMRNALFLKEGKSAAEVLARVSDGRHLLFASASDQERFHLLWNALWDEVLADYDSDNDPNGKIRSWFVFLNDRILATLRQLDAQGGGMEVFETPEFLELGRVSSMVSSVLEVFNHDESGDEVTLSEMEEMVPTLESAVDQLSKRLVKNNKLAKNKAVKTGRAASIYQLKITLKGSKPPIWRRILVSSDMELNDLHYVIQAAMGWDNDHLHQFKQGRSFYQPAPDDELSGFGNFEMEDSVGVRIDDLLLKEKQKILYEYDFGDSWEHEVLFEKVLEPDANVTYPVCVKGTGACPPEDCGGLWGYYNLLEVLGNPEDEEHESMLEWFGGPIDPSAFDLEEANACIRASFG